MRIVSVPRLTRLLPFRNSGIAWFVVLLAVSIQFPLSAENPEHPVIARSITGIEESGYDRPHLPPFKTSADGRIGLSMKSLGQGSANFYLLKPEGLASHFAESSDGVTILDLGNRYNVPRNTLHGSNGGSVHFGLWDPSEAPGADPNPYSLGDGKDYYDLTVICTAHYDDPNDPGTEYMSIWKTPIVVTVANPKTDPAVIEDIEVISTSGSPPFPANAMFEPQISNDGQLVMGRIAKSAHRWNDPASGVLQSSRFADIVYSYSSNGDPANWDAVIPISHAPYDSRINQKYGFAMQLFRDPEGNVIPDGYDIKGTYPWMSRDASLIGFTTVGSRLNDGGVERYPNSPLQGFPNDTTGESAGKTRGQILMGLWTQGKMVMLDNVLNGTDYGLQVGDEKQRLVTLYKANSGPAGNETGIIRVGSGRQANGTGWPANVSTNTTFFDTLESLVSYDSRLKIRTPFDVVWRVSNGRATEEFAFDDYTDLDGFIVSHMTAALSYGSTSTGNTSMSYHDGWNSSSKTFSNPVKFENAACATSDRWLIPDNGEAFGSMRVEPVALGGICGRGAWVDGNSGIKYTIGAQPQNVGNSDWYIGVFADCRFADSTNVDRLLFAFPDQTSVSLRGRSFVVYKDASGNDVAIINLPEALPDTGWSHLAVQVLNGGYEVEFYLNGLLYHRWTNPIQNLFQMVPGELSLAKIDGGSGSGFRGWLDEFKVFAHAMNPEVAANHAGGTLVGFDSSYSGPLTGDADLYPDWAHDELSEFLANQGEATFDYYVNWADYSADGAAHLLNIPNDVEGLRHQFLFPEGPLYHDAPRPESSQNKFCLTCHSTSSFDGLALAALSIDRSSSAAEDFRRQPSQQPREVGGVIPPAWLDGSPVGGTDLGAFGAFFDPWVLPSLSGTSLEVISFSLIDASSGALLMDIEDGSVIDYGKLGSSNVNIVANVNSAQGSVRFTFAGSTNYRTDNLPPNTLFGEAGEGILLGDLAAGSHTLTARPYTLINRQGTAGIEKTVTFTVTDLVATVQADSVDDYQSGTPAPGWSYLTNANGPIGSAVNYVSLPSSTSSNYVHPSNLAERRSTGGRPGWGSNQGESEDRYSISAFTVSLEGQYYLTDTLLKQLNHGGGNGTDLIVMVDDLVISTIDNPAAGQSTFDTNLGYLKPGEIIYVAVGPKGNRGSDLFDLDFTISYADLTLVANYRDDFHPVSPKRGWQYLWNRNGPVGDESGYVSMNWDGVDRYDSDAERGLPDSTELDWGRFDASGSVCPGDGAGGSITHDRCVIAAYSVRVAGDYVIADSIIDQLRDKGDGTEVFVYVNDDLVRQVTNGTDQETDFDCSLGYLASGDTIYVAIGPRGDNGSDAADIDFSILIDPE
ncbi:MAG: hypothetical protein P1U68_05610 [Verrucomicrobiales bacterium]|nr:hypothetical protein [Verrucomicrobiales bacterium]